VDVIEGFEKVDIRHYDEKAVLSSRGKGWDLLHGGSVIQKTGSVVNQGLNDKIFPRGLAL